MLSVLPMQGQLHAPPPFTAEAADPKTGDTVRRYVASNSFFMGQYPT
jgi:hypothetical protein